MAALVAGGLTNRQIAARLFLSERTAQNHVQHIPHQARLLVPSPDRVMADLPHRRVRL